MWESQTDLIICWLLQRTYTSIQKFGDGRIFKMFVEEVFYAHQEFIWSEIQ